MTIRILIVKNKFFTIFNDKKTKLFNFIFHILHKRIFKNSKGYNWILL